MIRTLCKVFMDHAHEMDLREMLDEVCYQVSMTMIGDCYKQAPMYEVRNFRRRLYFNPGLHSENCETAKFVENYSRREEERISDLWRRMPAPGAVNTETDPPSRWA